MPPECAHLCATVPPTSYQTLRPPPTPRIFTLIFTCGLSALIFALGVFTPSLNSVRGGRGGGGGKDGCALQRARRTASAATPWALPPTQRRTQTRDEQALSAYILRDASATLAAANATGADGGMTGPLSAAATRLGQPASTGVVFADDVLALARQVNTTFGGSA